MPAGHPESRLLPPVFSGAVSRLLFWLAVSGVTVAAAPPVILFQPVDQCAVTGGRTELGVSARTADGDPGTVSYQWFRNGLEIPGAAGRTLVFSSVKGADAGAYQVAVRGTSAETWSRTVCLHVAAEPPAPGTLAPEFVPDRIDDPYDDSPGTVYALRPLADGGVLIGGSFTRVNGFARPALAKLTVAGVFDPSFRFDGLPPDTVVRCMAALPGGGWIAGGASTTGKRPWLAAISAADGKVTSLEKDWSFGNTTGQEVRTLLVLPSGQILAGGTFTGVAGKEGYAAHRLIRLDTDGSLDTGFPKTDWNQGVLALALTPQGQVIVGGGFSVPRRCVARLNPAGGHDTAFAPQSPGTWSGVAEVSSLAVLEAGTIIAGGRFNFTPAGSYLRPALTAFRPDGAPDLNFAPKFNTDGKAEIRALIPDGPEAVIAAGRFTLANDTGPSGSPVQIPWKGVIRLNRSGRPVYPQQATGWDDHTVWSLAMTAGRNRPRVLLAGGDFSWPSLRLAGLRADAPLPFAPVLTGGPAPRTASLRAGDPLKLSVAVSGWPAPECQWYRNGLPVPGATGSALYIPCAAASHAGRYNLYASNGSGNVVSETITVNVFASAPGRNPLVSAAPGAPLTIGEFGSNYSSVRMNVSFVPSRVTVSLTLEHPDLSDLTATLVSPRGLRRVILFPLTSSSPPAGRNFENTVFDDASTRQLNDTIAPYRGTFQTGGRLKVLQGMPADDASGDWSLQITNDGAQPAVLESWQLMIEGEPGPVTYDAWRQAALPGSLRGAFNQDADGDGYSNAHQWLFGLAPWAGTKAPGGIQSICCMEDGSRVLEWSGWQSVSYQLEWSTDMRYWQAASEGTDYFTTWVTATDAARRRHRVLLGRSSPSIYWRLRGS